MEEAVNKCASLLLSSSPEALVAAVDFVEGLSNERWSAEICSSRLFQELLAYKRGAILDHLLRQMQKDPGNCKSLRIQQLYSCRMIVTLSENEAIAKYCAKDEQRAGPLAKALLKAQAYLLHIIPGQLREKNPIRDHELLVNREEGKGKLEFLDLALENVKGFANFLSASKHFRLALQQVDGFFRDLESVVARNIIKRASADLQVKAAINLSRLLQSLCRFGDTQDWALDSGLLRINAAAIRLLTLDGVTEGFVQIWKDVGMLPSGPFPTGRQMRNRLKSCEKTLFDLDRRIQNSSDPRVAKELRQMWMEMAGAIMAPKKAALVGGPSALPYALQERDHEHYGFATGLVGTKVNVAPIVCSWEECKEGSVLDAGRQFSKCANCSLAFYCSKEHQKRHWSIHKKECKFGTSDKAPPHKSFGRDASHLQLLYSPE